MSPINYEGSMTHDRELVGVHPRRASQLLYRKRVPASDRPIGFVSATPEDIQKQIPSVSQDLEPLASSSAGPSQAPQPSTAPLRTPSTFPLQTSFDLHSSSTGYPSGSTPRFEDLLLAAGNGQSSSPINAATTTATVLTTVYMTADASPSPSSSIASGSSSISNSIRVMTILGLTVGGILLIAAVVGLTFFIRRWRRVRRDDAETGRMGRAVTQYTPSRITIDGQRASEESFQQPQIQVPPLVSVRASLPPPPYQPSSGRPSLDTLKGNSWGSSRSGLRSLYLSNMP